MSISLSAIYLYVLYLSTLSLYPHLYFPLSLPSSFPSISLLHRPHPNTPPYNISLVFQASARVLADTLALTAPLVQPLLP